VTDFDENQHRITGDAATAIEDSGLPDEDKDTLRRFVGRFPSLRFAREEDALLDHYEAVDQVTLPAWFRASRSTLAAIEPYSRLRIDAFWFDGRTHRPPARRRPRSAERRRRTGAPESPEAAPPQGDLVVRKCLPKTPTSASTTTRAWRLRPCPGLSRSRGRNG
jgi:hypothetical protein